MHPFIELAHKAIKIYLETGQVVPPPTPLPENMANPGATFVSLHAADGQLRGCRGTITPTKPTLAEAIIHTAISSAVDDSRFPPITLSEIQGLQIKVDVLSSMEPVTDTNLLDEKIYGVLIESGNRRALLLPNISAVKSVPHQLELVRRKAGLTPTEPAELYQFTVTRYSMDDDVNNYE